MTDTQKEKIIRFRRMGYGYADIGRELKISKETVKSFCRRNNLTMADVSKIDPTTICRECGAAIKQQPKSKKRIFCCKACREKWWSEHRDMVNKKAIYAFICVGCGKAFTAYGNSRRKYCSHACYISDRFGGGSGE